MALGFPQFHTLKSRIMVGVLGMFLLSIWLLTLSVSRFLRSDLAQLLGEQQAAAVSLVTAEIIADFKDRSDALNLIASEIDPSQIKQPAALQRHLEARPVLQVLFNAGVWVTDLDGTAIAELPRMGRLGLNYMAHDHIVAALQEGRASVGRPAIGKTVRTPSFAMSVPIRDAQGRVIGALAAATDLSKANFLDSINNSRYGNSGGYLILDPKHRVLISATANNLDLLMQPLPAPGVSPVRDQGLPGFDGTALMMTAQGSEVLTSSSRIPLTGWLVIATLPTEQAFAPIHLLERRLYACAAILTLLSLWLTWWLLQRLLAPLQIAAHAVGRLADKDAMDMALPLAGNDEIGELIGGLNRVLRLATQREKALLASEQRFRHFFEKNSSVQLLIEPRSGLIEDANQAAVAYYGYARERLVGMPISDINTLTPARVEEERLLAAREARNFFQFQHRLADGELRDVEVHSTPVESHERILLLSIIHDVTERKLTQDQLSRSLIEQKAILNSNIAGIVKLQDRHFVWMNHSFAAMLGYRVEELVGQSTERVYVDAVSYRRFAAQAYPVLERGEIFRTEIQYRCKDGSLGWYDVSGELLADQRSESIWCFIDITEKKAVSLRLERLVCEQRSLLNNDLVGIVTTRERHIVWANRAFEKMLGYQEGELAGKPTRQSYVSDEAYAVLQPDYLDLAAGKVVRTQAALVCKNGAAVWADISGEMLDRSTGETLWGVIDVTQRKLMEDRVRELAFHDTLTQLPNRRLLMDRLSQAMAASKRSGRYAALIFLDLDNFKPLNDEHGHDVGDLLLVEVARRLINCVREVDTVARFGGDEFVVMLRDLDTDRTKSRTQALCVAEEVRHSLSEPYTLIADHGNSAPTRVTHRCSASLGIALFNAHSGSEEEILHWADSAMYQAKQAGCNQLHFDENQRLS